MKENSVESKINNAMKSLDDLQRAHASEEFYEKLIFRINQNKENSRSFHWLQVGAAAMIIMALCNIYILFNTEKNNSSSELSDFTEEYFALTTYEEF